MSSGVYLTLQHKYYAGHLVSGGLQALSPKLISDDTKG